MTPLLRASDTQEPLMENPAYATMETVRSLVGRQSRHADALIEAHRAAEDFHSAMAEALEAERELDECARDPEWGDRGYWADHYRVHVAKAAVAFQKMPALWGMILSAQVKS